MDDKTISAEFPFESRYIEILGSKLHYIEEGSGDPILFLHGNPTSSYLWRNIIPYVSSFGRCIAPDLIGMGKSDKPDINYRFFDHYRYIEEFIDKMKLQNITMVLHDWGSGIGFHYAMKNQDNIKGLAFMEAILGTADWKDFPTEFKMAFKMFRTPGVGWFMISAMNVFVEKILPEAIIRDLSEEEMIHYRAPFKKVKDRLPVRVWPMEIPIEGKPSDVHRVVEEYHQKLQTSAVPKLLFYAHPGGIVRSDLVEWCRENLKNLDTVDLGEGIHYLQEDHPHEIGRELAVWYQKISR